MQVILLITCAIACTAALTLKGQKNVVNEPTLSLLVTDNNPAEIEEAVRKARQIYEDINIDIIQGGGGGYGGYGGYGGFNNGYGGYGGYGGGRGYQETDVDIIVENFGK